MIKLLMIMALFFITISAAEAMSIKAGELVPDFSLKTLNGSIASLMDYRGKTTVIIYWRPGQGRSQRTLKDAAKISKKSGNDRISFVTVVAEVLDFTDIIKLLRDEEIDFPVLIDKDHEIFGKLGIRVYPTTIAIDAEGRLMQAIPGHPPAYMQMLQNILAQKQGGDGGPDEQGTSLSASGDDSSSVEIDMYYNTALKFAESGQIELAIKTAEKSVRSGSERSAAHELLGFLFLNNKNAERAEQEFKSALSLDSSSPDALTGLGASLIAQEKVDDAISVLKEAVKGNPHPARALYELGRAYTSMGMLDKASLHYQKALQQVMSDMLLPSEIKKCR
ncbi:MAG: tetratricopeptide repeat protein [Nitrospira sp.]|nr:tetratricopeptide repeat protein [bacterium]MBL7049943.1 tetratricopeptide repeat protein [Nitrospira sp.]